MVLASEHRARRGETLITDTLIYWAAPCGGSDRELGGSSPSGILDSLSEPPVGRRVELWVG